MRLALLAIALSIAGCTSVQFTSPYNAEIASGLSKLYQDVLTTSADISRNALNPATRAKAAYENYAKTYEDWLARVETMRVMSELGNPQALNCADVAKKLGTTVPGIGVADMSDVHENSAALDCQTTLLLRLKTRINQTADLHKLACAPDNKNIVNDCAGGF